MTSELGQHAVRAELAAVEAQLGRIDSKAALLLGLAGAGATAGPAVILGTDLPAVAAVLAWLTVVLFAVAAAMLALTVRPALRLTSGRQHGFVLYGSFWPKTGVAEAVLAVAVKEQRAECLAGRLVDLSILAVAKYRRLRVAIDLMLAGLGLAAVGALLSLVVTA